MARYGTGNLNTTTNGGAEVVYTIVTTLVASGVWTKTRDSDGTTYSSSGTQVTGPGTGANGLNNNRAWVQVTDSNGRSWVFQRSTTTDYQWRVKFSFDGFEAGSPSATQVPAATTSAHEVILFGSGSDASPTFSNLFPTTAGSYKADVIAEDVLVNGEYGFWVISRNDGTLAPNAAIFQEPMNTSPSDPVPLLVAAATSQPWSGTSSAMANVYGLYPGPQWLLYSPSQQLHMSSNSAAPGTAYGPNPWSSEDVVMAQLWGRITSNTGAKGTTGYFRIGTQNRANGDLLDLTAFGAGGPDAGMYAFFGSIFIPYLASVTPS